MKTELLNKNNSGIAGEFLVSGELARRGYNVTMTLGNTKSIDLLIEKHGRLIPIQVKSIQRKKSICWNISLSKIKGEKLMYVLVNLHADLVNEEHPEYFILTQEEVQMNFKPTKSGRDYLDYNNAIRLGCKNAWHKFEADDE